MSFIRRMVDKFMAVPESIRYLIIGGATTAFNYAVHGLCMLIFNWNYQLNVFVAWAAAVVFAYFANKYFVFSTKTDTKNTLREAGSFVLMRAVSYGLEALIMYVLVDRLHLHQMLAKIPTNILVIIANYAFSKLFIFKKPAPAKEENP